MGLFCEKLTVCHRSWDEVLAKVVPWARTDEMERYDGWAVFGAALVLTLILSTLTPRAWRKNITLLGLLGLGGGTWVLGMVGLLVLHAFEVPQQYLFDEVVSIQKEAGDVQWADVKGVRDLDRVLMDHNLRPELQVAEITLKPVHGKVALLQAPGAGEQLKEVDSGEKLVTTGRQEIRAHECFVEVTVQEQAEKVGSAAADRATRLSPVIEEPVKEEVKPAPVTAWVSADDVEYIDFAPPIIDPVGKVFRVYQPLNFRGSPGVQHQALMTPLPSGMVVEAIGPTQCDWWKVKAMDTGEEGWVNSLWLRIAGARAKARS